MPDVRTFQSVVDAAEKAAAAGDVAGAEALLREAAGVQEAEFGPLHPDLASTFNNLAVVCEMAERPAEAERFYRRAHAIATATLGPDHPLVATSRDNLSDFCQARGLPLEEWAAAPVAAPAATPAVTPAVPEPAREPGPAVTVAPARHSIRRASLWAALILAGLAVVAGVREWSAPPGPVAETPAPTRPERPAAGGPPGVVASLPTATPPPASARTPEPAAPAPRPSAPAPRPPAPAPPDAEVSTVAPRAAAPARPAPAADTAGPAGVRVVVATLCRGLTASGAWRCTPAGDTSAPGVLSYYTRIASPRGLRVRHQWYQDDRLRQDVALRVGASAREGYRTFSRQTAGPGEWRVELRAESGALLDQARVVVR